MSIKLIQGDCLDKMKDIPDKSIDMVLADPPYGSLAFRWDSVIPLEPMWEHLIRITKPKAAIVMTASQPFTTTIISSNLKMFKYCWVWEKEQGTMPMNAKYQPIKVHEDIVVFSKMASTFSLRGTMAYYPQMTKGKPYKSKGEPHKRKDCGRMKFHGSLITRRCENNAGTRYPRSVQRFITERQHHPTQKPVALMEYLIKTYTLEGETVLDFVMGSGTTGVACQNTGRNFIGIELDEKYFKIAERRMAQGRLPTRIERGEL